jgi:DNA repair protein RadC
LTRRLSIKFWPDSERPRERLLEKGGDALSDAQLLAILLRTGDQGISALDLAIQLLDQFGGFAEIERASIPELTELKGIGPAKAAQVKAAIEISRRIGRSDEIKKPRFTVGRISIGFSRRPWRALAMRNSGFSFSIQNTA